MSSPPFEGYTPLSTMVWFKDKRPESKNDPTPFLILCMWMNAPDKLVRKYLTSYEELFPNHSIILITTDTGTMFFSPQGEKSRLLLRTIDMIRMSGDNTSFIAAAYSNGGVSSLNNLMELYRIRKRSPLPLEGLLLDSAPGEPESALSENTHRAFYRGLPPWARNRAPLSWFTSWFIWFILWIWGKLIEYEWAQNPIQAIYDELHDEKRYSKGRRTYVYSKSDDIVPWVGPTKSADQSEKQGWDVRREEFEGSMHVAHSVKDKERYWRIVEETLGKQKKE